MVDEWTVCSNFSSFKAKSWQVLLHRGLIDLPYIIYMYRKKSYLLPNYLSVEITECGVDLTLKGRNLPELLTLHRQSDKTTTSFESQRTRTIKKKKKDMTHSSKDEYLFVGNLK